MMRKLLTFLQAVAISTLIAGCGGTGTENEPEITPEIKFTEDIVTSGISVESAEQSITLSFSTNVAWSATVSADWLTISPSSGEAGKNSVKVEVEENRTGQPRSATITISDKESMQKVSVTVRQEALKASLTVSPESLEFSANKGEEMLNVTSNTDWVITKDAEWITLDSDKGKGLATIAAGVTENTSLTSRTGSITVSTSDGSVKKTVSVRQSGADVVFSVDKNEHSVAAAGGDFTVKVTHNIGYKINSQPEWVKQPDKANSGNVDTYTFTAEANTSTEAREGIIVFCNDNNECVPVTVKQAGANATLSVSPAELTFTANTESKSLDVTSNTAWTAASGASWAKLNKTNGSGNAQIAVTAEENTAITQRSATITIKTADGKASATVKVTQSAANVIFSVDKNEHSVAAAGGDFTVKVTRNIGYKINSQPEWVKQTGKVPSGNTDTYTFTAEANTSTEAREGVIVFCNDNNECIQVTVKQAGAKASLSVSPAELTFTAKPESKSFSVSSNTDWSVASSADWVKIGTTSGSGNAHVTASAEENTATTQRTATITLKTTDGKATATIKVTQNPADVVFSIDIKEFSIDAKGEEITIKIKHNSAYSVKSMPDWVNQTNKTVSGDTDNISFAVQHNPGYKRQGEIIFNGDGIYGTVTIKQFGSKADGGNDDTTTGGKITLE
ncbi:MAG: BACON domain-containing carbohydrate-binding protein [Candidatus Cryptobacteroides sp.]|nr:BACON domain-containing carbohydrate-binding protein [Candidatus Cryptobacteroides sp.]